MKTKSQQLNINGQLEINYDDILPRKKMVNFLSNIFGDKIEFKKINNKTIPIVKNSVALLCSQITYLGNPHPIYKKRIQLKKWYFEIIQILKKQSINCLFIGIYFYKNNIIFCDFDKSLYLNKKMHNSSAHIYINDMYQAMINGKFEKNDRNGNKIRVFNWFEFKLYILSDKLSGTFNDLLNVFNNFNKSFEFGKKIWAIHAIKEMRDNHFKKWKETEWPGWFLEYRFDKYIKNNNLTNLANYLNNNKKIKQLDFDLYFPVHNFMADLKASSINKLQTILNDASNVDAELSKYGKLWYIIYEHDTVKDNTLQGHPMTRLRIQYIRQFEPNYKFGNDLSYLSRMKANVTFKRMFIFEINKVNISSLLEKMTNNFHQPDKKTLRKPKFRITKKNLDNAIIYRYSV